MRIQKAINLPETLIISPAACIPHNSRPFRVILDLSYSLLLNGLVYLSSVNDTTDPAALPAAMGQLGSCLRCLVAHMADNHDPNNLFAFSKLDVADGFGDWW